MYANRYECTHYVQDTPLDLSCANIKTERDLLESPMEPVNHTSLDYYKYPPVQYYVSPSSVPVGSPPAYYGYADHQPAYTTLSSGQISPESFGRAALWSPHTGTNSGPSPPQSLYNIKTLDDDQEYLTFEEDALRAMAEKNGGALLGSNPRMRRAVQTNEPADDTYRKQRARNNQAAKQSRDRRKIREVRLALQVTFLKKKRAALKARLATGLCGQCQQM